MDRSEIHLRSLRTSFAAPSDVYEDSTGKCFGGI